MRHQLNSQPHELLFIIKRLPSSVSVLKSFVGLIVLEGEELLFTSDKGKTFDQIVHFFPHVLCKYSEFEDSSILETDQ